MGEFGFDTTNEILKIGNGFDPWLVLEPFSTGAEAIALIKVIEGGEASTVDFDQIIDGGIHNTTYTETLDGGDSLHGRTDTG